MKRIHAIFAIALCVALILPLYLTVQAQRGDGSYMEAYVPDSAETSSSPVVPEGTVLVEKQMTLDNQLDGQAVHTELSFSLASAPVDAAWTELTERFALAVSGEIANGSGKSADQLARSLEAAVRSQIDVSAEGLASGRIYLTAVKVTLPYFEELKRGSRNDQAKKLQETLIELGYLTGIADGQYGKKTADAVEALEQYIRQLEQDAIDANATPTPAPTPTSDPAATPDPNATAAPTPQPAPTPETKADGIADSTLQAFLMDESFPSARANLKYGDKGDAVLRFQRRLQALGYLIGSPDGFYGADTQLGVRLLQYYNAHEQTGAASIDLQKLVFSGNANAPANPMLQKGSSGDDVRKLQERLRILGFMLGNPDGSYGPATVRGIENLQTYFQAQEREALTAAAITNGTPAGDIKIDDAGSLTTVINGIADPMLLDKFYAEDFPEIPGAMSIGASSEEVKRVQRRLYDLEYQFRSADGAFGGGTERSIKDFQKRNGLSQTGIADQITLEKLFSDSAKKALRPYILKVSIAKQRVYAYGLDDNEEYTVLLRTMKASTGLDDTPTPKGTYQATTGPGARWHYFKKYFVWGQYAYYIEGDYLFHSILYDQKGGKPNGSQYSLGRKASHGCVRLTVEDAKWIYQNCPPGTTVVIY